MNGWQLSGGAVACLNVQIVSDNYLQVSPTERLQCQFPIIKRIVRFAVLKFTGRIFWRVPTITSALVWMTTALRARLLQAPYVCPIIFLVASTHALMGSRVSLCRFALRHLIATD
jgi:hypothetical protein